MIRTPRPLALLALGTALAALAAPAHAQERVEVGNAASVVGQVRLGAGPTAQPRQIERRQRIAWGDRIETGRDSQLQILLLDRSTFGMGARSRLTIDRFVYDPNEGRSLFATITQGALRFFSGRSNAADTAEITMPSGRIGIRGTALDMLVGERARGIARDEPAVERGGIDRDEATLVVLRGPGENTAGGLTPGLATVTAAGVTVVLDRPGLAAFIPRNGAPPQGPFQISDAGLARVQARVMPAVADARGGDGFLNTLIPVAVGAAAVVGAAVLLSGGDDDNDDPGPTGAQGPGTSPTAPPSPNQGP
ncbi:FecR family protein [Altererythrobacter sp. KTW20L]|uniref:FecR family protein n=1 Tax=Altererythrobacter sp. KTW20L TaxID=2942210 RepID=UPI0020C12304|nr:FecR family protein [Altererythrobacter sp. KTW20L]MCL6252065.1 FecR family protein [Altererythrobacter sp. KTW20L]